MKTLEKDQEKIQKICDELRQQTLEPAKVEAEKIIAEANARSEEIIKEAKAHSRVIVEEGKKQVALERAVFNSSLSQATNQCLEALRQSIEKSLFNDSLNELLTVEMVDPKVIANMIKAIIESIEKNGIRSDLSVIIPQSVSPEMVNRLLAQHILNKLKNQTVQVGSFDGGIQVKLSDKKMTLDITDVALEDFLKQYLRKDFRKLIFRTAIES